MIKKLLRYIFRHNFYFKNSYKFYNYAYKDKIYTPYYNMGYKMESVEPEIYNKEGKKMDVWFIRDSHASHCPYRNSSKYYIWDRYNIGLNTHFYTHESMLQTMGTPLKRYGMFVESEFIVPESYKIFNNYPKLFNDFDSIFTYSEEHLNHLPNAKLFTSCATVWYGSEQGCSVVRNDAVYKEKKKNISIVCSNKRMTKYHEIRHNFATAAKKSGMVDIFGTFENGNYVKFKANTLKDYRYQIVIENGIAPYYFTEKILDCFASMTVPIYLGAGKISEFFNENGIIIIKPQDYEKIDLIISKCNEKLYEMMLPAIKDNYNRVLKYTNVNDRLYEEYFK